VGDSCLTGRPALAQLRHEGFLSPRRQRDFLPRWNALRQQSVPEEVDEANDRRRVIEWPQSSSRLAVEAEFFETPNAEITPADCRHHGE